VQSDAQIVREVCAGEVAMYAVLVRRYERLVRAAILRKIADRHLADDLVQDTFMIAFASLSTLRNGSLFGPWLLRIARNRASRSYRHAARHEVGAVDFDAMPSAAATGLSDESRDLLELVERLPEQERVLVGLKFFEGHTAADIAEITGRPVGTITKQLSRAYARLGKWLELEARR
jgi:RNA polymerase sigma-70 factor, ECF subfamily